MITALIRYKEKVESGKAMIDDWYKEYSQVFEFENYLDLNEVFSNILSIQELSINNEKPDYCPLAELQANKYQNELDYIKSQSSLIPPINRDDLNSDFLKIIEGIDRKTGE